MTEYIPTAAEREGLIEGGILNLESDGYTRQAEAIRWLRDEWAKLAGQPSGYVELPDTITGQEFEKFRKAWAEATSGPGRLAILSYEWGVRVDWADKSVQPYDDIPYPSRAEAEEEVALDPQWRTLIRRTVVQRMPERGEWHPAADLATCVLTPDGLVQVGEQETPSDHQPGSETLSHE